MFASRRGWALFSKPPWGALEAPQGESLRVQGCERGWVTCASGGSGFHLVEDLAKPSRSGLGRAGVLGRQLLEGGDFLLVEGLFPAALTGR